MGLHGKPDWGLQLKSTVYTIDDLSELAVRLGSEVFFDRRGDVIFIDNFEGGVGRWITSNPEEPDSVLLTSEISRSGGYSVKLTGISPGLESASMYARIPYPVLSKWGFELHIAMGSEIDYLLFYLTKYTGTHFKTGHIKYDRTNQKLQRKVSLTDYEDIVSPFKLYQSRILFHVFKLVIDLETDKFHRLIVNEKTYDLSAHDIYSHVDTVTSPHVAIGIEVYSHDGDKDYIYVDNVIVTQNEP